MVRISEERFAEIESIFVGAMNCVGEELWLGLKAEVEHNKRLESAALDAAKYLGRKQAGQDANGLAHDLIAAVEGWEEEP